MSSKEHDQKLQQLCDKYSGNVPRYTSYPTAAELRPCSDLSGPQRAIQEIAISKQPLSLYLHLPFCPSLCYFCACNKIISQDPQLKQDYLSLLRIEAQLLRSKSSEPIKLAQIHWGGGSPSYLTAEQLGEAMSILEENFDCQHTAERSVEVDPRTLSAEKAQTLYQLGFRRISLGIQDLDPEIQRLIHRVQPLSLVRETLDYLRQIGFAEINFDLIYGLPEQNLRGFGETLDEVIKLGPSRIALYGYAHVKWKEKVQNVFEKYHLPSSLERLKLFQFAESRFAEAGYVGVGLDHFCKPDDELAIARGRGTLRRNFMGYTVLKAQHVLGLGISSISDLGQWLFQNHTELEMYQQSLTSKGLPIARALERSFDDGVRARLIESLMCNGRLRPDVLDFSQAEREAAQAALVAARSELTGLAGDGLIEMNGDHLVVTGLGRIFMRNIAACFDSYLAKHSASSKPTFSKAL